jgi:hypothetical protein
MKVYVTPTLDYILFDDVDIITTSGPSTPESEALVDPLGADLEQWDLEEDA